MIKIFGHRSPDTDSTGSPLIWEWYLNNVHGVDAKAKLLGTPNNEALFVLDKWGLDQPEIIEDITTGDDVIIVDTNNPSELPDNIHNANIVEIIDHHLLQGGLATRLPITVTIRPVACTATIMHRLMGNDASKMPAKIQGLMLSCIMSDTLAFRSPTTTNEDKELVEHLASRLGIDLDAYADEMFKAKSDVSSLSDSELLRMDSKKYELSGKWYRVSVVETTNPPEILARKESLMATMPRIAVEDSVDEVLLFVIDIFNEDSILIVPNDAIREIAERCFDTVASGDNVVLRGIISRKKQIIPSLSRKRPAEFIQPAKFAE